MKESITTPSSLLALEEANSLLDKLDVPPTVIPVVSEFIMDQLVFSFHFIIHVIIQVFGMVANVVNVTTFVKMGVEDCVTVSFFALAISDFFYLFFYLAARVFKLIDFEYPLSKLPYILIFYNPVFLDISTLVTVFLAVQKSCCVMIPFLFKNIFTRKVSVYVIVSIYLLIIASYIPFLSSHGFETKFSSTENKTVLAYFRLKRRTQAFFYWRLLNRTIIPAIAQILVFTSAIILTAKLKSSARFRHSANAGEKSQNQSQENAKLGQKERRAIQAVNTVTIIFFICNLPENLLHLTTVIYPEFRKGERYENLYQVLSSLQNTFFLLNASVNILVYLRYNTKYYTTFRKMFSLAPKTADSKQ